jgi:hypothetical protein
MIKDHHINKINKSLEKVDWSVLNVNSTTDGFNTFINTTNRILDQHAPIKQHQSKTKTNKHSPWVTSGIIKSSNILSKK